MNKNLTAMLTEAARRYKTKQPADAAEICELILEEQPQNFAALHLLGVIRWSQGRLQEALALQKAALLVHPGSYGAHTYIGLILASLRRYQEAIYSYQRVLGIKPKYSEVLYRLGNALKAMGRYEEAIASYSKALTIKPGFAEAHFNLGVAFHALNRLDEAIHSYQRALAIDPSHAAAHNNLGNVLEEVGRYEEAIASYYRALAIKPSFAEAHNNLGNSLQEVGHYEEAMVSYRRALAIKPDFAQAEYNLGNALLAWDCYKEAMASYDRALAIKSDYAEAHAGKSFAALTVGDFETGWAEYEWRWKTAKGLRENRNFKQPLWLGRENVAGKTVLLYGEQGLGDTIQFVRYVPLVATLGATVILEVQKSLKTLLGNSISAKAIFERGEPLPSFDVHCPLMSLPLAFRTELATIPAAIPYLLADPTQQAEWERRLPKGGSARIGIAWSGNPKHQQDHNRSIPLQKLMPLIGGTGLNFYLLQKEIRSADFGLLKGSASLTNLSGQLKDFADTAALVSLMDLVISVDTSLAHLAGAMGKPTWILLAFNADWRWGRTRPDSRWYSTVRLFRQTKPCDWTSVIETVLLECKKLFVARPSGLSHQDRELPEARAKSATR